VPRTPVPTCTQHSLQKKCTYIYAYTHKHTRTYAQEYMCAPKTPPKHTEERLQKLKIYAQTCIHIHIHMYIHTCVYLYIYTCRYIHICLFIHTHTYTHIHTRIQDVHMHAMHVHTHTYIHTCTHTHTRCTYARTQARLERRRCSDCVRSPT